MSKKDTSRFEERCRKLSQMYGIAVSFYADNLMTDDAFEDDGCLHVVRDGRRACFDVGSDHAEEHNANSRKVLAGLKILPSPRTMVEEEEDGGVCPHCGRPLQ